MRRIDYQTSGVQTRAGDPHLWPSLLRLLALANAALPFACGVGLLAWVVFWRPNVPVHPADWGDMEGAALFLTGLVLAALAVPYLVVTVGVWRSRRWAVAALAGLAGAQGLFQSHLVLGELRVSKVLSAGDLAAAGYTLMLLATAAVAARGFYLMFLVPRRAGA
jgi:hypothetical protein